MSLIKSFCIWNNKGGVGKSTICFNVAARYAESNPDKKILVIDLCPQANVSMMLLGGGTTGEANVMNRCTKATPETVVGYLASVLSGGSGAPLPNSANFLTHINPTNPNLPDNMYLLCGDGNLEPMAPAISNAAAAPPLIVGVQPWLWVHQIFRRLIENVTDNDEAEWMVFIDTNPSFGIYTELAISAVDYILCPVNADDSSRIATSAMFILLHGMIPPHPVYGSWTFAVHANNSNLTVPKIHLIIGNRLTQYLGAAAAYAALSDATATNLYNHYVANPTYFSPPNSQIGNVDDFRKEYSVTLRDFNTAGVVAAHLGQLMSNMTQKTYSVHGQNVQVKAQALQECVDALDAVIEKL